MKTLLLFFLLQGAHWEPLHKATGEIIELTYDDEFEPGESGKFILYWKSSMSSTPLKLMEKTSGLFRVTMPGGTHKEYRFFVVPVLLNSAGTIIASGPESNVVLVVRK